MTREWTVTCVDCGAVFSARGPATKRCSACAAAAKRRYFAEYAREHSGACVCARCGKHYSGVMRKNAATLCSACSRFVRTPAGKMEWRGEQRRIKREARAKAKAELDAIRAEEKRVKAIEAARPKSPSACPLFKCRSFPANVNQRTLCRPCACAGFANVCMVRRRCRFVPSTGFSERAENPCDARNYANACFLPSIEV